MSDEGAPRNVVEALIRVVRDLPAVGKDQKMGGESGGYAYRGIEAMTTAAAPLFGKHGVLVCPRVLESTTAPITKGGKPWVHREMRVEYVLRGPNGPEDCVLVGPFVAEADDNSDKSANKAMTQAYKQMLLQVLVISDRKDDPDDSDVSRDREEDLSPPLFPPSWVDGYLRLARGKGLSDAEIEQIVLAVSDGRAREVRYLYQPEQDALNTVTRDVLTAKIAPPAPEVVPPDGGPASPDVDGASETSKGEGSPQGPPAGGVQIGSRAKAKSDAG